MLLPLANPRAHVLLLLCVCLLPVLLQAASLLQTDRSEDTAPVSSGSRRQVRFNIGGGHSHHNHGHGRNNHHHALKSPPRPNRRDRTGTSTPLRLDLQRPKIIDTIHPGKQRKKLQADRNPTFRDIFSRTSSSSQGTVLNAALDSMFEDIQDSREKQRAKSMQPDIRQADNGGGDDSDDDDGYDDDGDDDKEEDATRNGLQQKSAGQRRLIPCPGCQQDAGQDTQRTINDAPQQHQLSQAEMKELLIERIKQQILLKLRLPFTPNITRRHSRLPEPLSRNNRMMGDQAMGMVPDENNKDGTDDFYGRTTEVVTFGTTVRGCHSSRPAGCFHFDLQGNLNADDVTSAELWVYKLPDDGDRRQQTLVFSELTGPGYNTTQRSQELGHKYVSAKKRWVRFNVKSAVQRWLDDPKRNFGLLVSCKTCNRHISSSPIGSEDEIKPFIVVQTTDNHRRYRRTTNDCADRTDNHCCREHLYLNFAEIDWDHWITYPEGYTANYCKGVCYGPVPISPRYHHSTIMQEVANTRKKEELAPCCAPRHMSSISLLYFVEDGKIIRKTLPNMVVESCGCT